jgi:hypothetical protein
MKTDLAFIFSIVSILFTGITAFFSILSYSKVVGLEKSTHRIQYVPYDYDGNSTVNGETPLTGEELEKQMNEAFGYKDLEENQI